MAITFAFFAIKDDLIHAGASYVDEEVVVDGNLITSRKPDDLPAFCRAIIIPLMAGMRGSFAIPF
jgi:protease I